MKNATKASRRRPTEDERRTGRTRWIEKGELTCSGPGCSKPIPAGYYRPAKRKYFCSDLCAFYHYLPRRRKQTCAYCGRKFIPTGSRRQAVYYCSPAHFGAARQRRVEMRAGRFEPQLRAFMEDCLPRHYAPSTFRLFRSELSQFFAFLVRRRIRSLESVKPGLISAYLSEMSATRNKSTGKSASMLACYFDWLIENRQRKSPNPVVLRFHGRKTPRRLPRPFSREELERIWTRLEECGDLQLKLAVALGEESALRISEVANVRVEDVDLKAQQVFVRLPNKTNTERMAPFHVKVWTFAGQWLAERGKRSHDHLLVNDWGRPMGKHTLRERLNELLKPVVPGWHFHRLRHQASSALHAAGADTTTIMASFGWRNPGVMQGYTQVLPGAVRASYDQAMAARGRAEARPSRRQSLAEFFAKDAAAPATPKKAPGSGE